MTTRWSTRGRPDLAGARHRPDGRVGYLTQAQETAALNAPLGLSARLRLTDGRTSWRISGPRSRSSCSGNGASSATRTLQRR